ncbi:MULTISPECIES: DUF4190 domain-containing protein [unclassified Cryobacterium]|uniref:DUF4190 domain-containing protein n=1 Tax=unclassified Cryobacterium TaxID=2649013 RepID=UPI001444E082|nr:MULTISPECIES: DUF4190 domain-containing protein [unclassified Cryobacterium]
MTNENDAPAQPSAVQPPEAPPVIAQPAPPSPYAQAQVTQQPVNNPYAQNPYATQPYNANYGAPQDAKGLSIASMVIGIVSLVLMFFYIGWLTGIAAVIFGHIAMKKEPAGKGMALAGLITGYVAIGLSLIFLIFAVLFFGFFMFALTGAATSV